MLVIWLIWAAEPCCWPPGWHHQVGKATGMPAPRQCPSSGARTPLPTRSCCRWWRQVTHTQTCTHLNSDMIFRHFYFLIPPLHFAPSSLYPQSDFSLTPYWFILYSFLRLVKVAVFSLLSIFIFFPHLYFILIVILSFSPHKRHKKRTGWEK